MSITSSGIFFAGHTQEGNGLGLALVKRVLDIESGEIQVQNLSPQGCCFTVILNTKK